VATIYDKDISKLKEPKLSKLILELQDKIDKQRELANRAGTFGFKRTTTGEEITSPRYDREAEKFESLRKQHLELIRHQGKLENAEVYKRLKEKIAKKYPDYDKMPEVRQQGILVEEMNLRFEELDAKSEDWKKFTAKEAREHARLDNDLYEASEMKEGEEQAKKEIKREQLKSKNPNVTFMEDKKREILERKGVITFPSKLNPKEQERLTDLISRLEEQKEQKRQKKEEAVQERRGQFRVVKKGETGLPVEKQNTNVISDSEFSKRSNTKADIIPISKHRNPNIISKYIKTRNKRTSNLSKADRRRIATMRGFIPALGIEAYREEGMEGVKGLIPYIGAFELAQRASRLPGAKGILAKLGLRGVEAAWLADTLYSGYEDVKGLSEYRKGKNPLFEPTSAGAKAGIASRLLGEIALSDLPKVARERLHSWQKYGTPERAAKTRRERMRTPLGVGGPEKAKPTQSKRHTQLLENLNDMRKSGLVLGGSKFENQYQEELKNLKTEPSSGIWSPEYRKERVAEIVGNLGRGLRQEMRPAPVEGKLSREIFRGAKEKREEIAALERTLAGPTGLSQRDTRGLGERLERRRSYNEKEKLKGMKQEVQDAEDAATAWSLVGNIEDHFSPEEARILKGDLGFGKPLSLEERYPSAFRPWGQKGKNRSSIQEEKERYYEEE